MVPSGWTQGKVKDLIKSLDAGVSVNSDDDGNLEAEFKILKTSCVSGSSFDFTKVKSVIIQSEIDRLKEPVLADSIIVSRMNTPALVGANGYVENEITNTYLPDRLWQLKPYKGKVSMRWLGYWFASSPTRHQLSATATGTSGSMKNITKTDVLNININIPPLPEQQKIAKILTTWDKAINTTERLIENSKQQKKALMQQLLTGQKRFGFDKNSYELKKTRYGDIPKEWKYIKIKEVAKQVTKKNSDNHDYPVISCSKHYGFVNSLEYFKKQVFSDNTTGYRIIPRDCFGFPANHIEEGSIGLQTLHDYALVSPIYVVFKADQKVVNNIYLYALLKTEHYRQIFSASTNASVDRRGSLRWNEFSEIHIPLPPLEEQQKIAAVLTTADTEIEVLEQQLADIQQEKKALMQQLLTGKKRVKVD